MERDKEGPVPPKSVKSKWPAIILAASRIAKVPGRIILLIVSITTIKGIRAAGVPWGTKWANICWVWLIQPKIIKVIQSGRESESVIAIWLDLVNTYGSNPKELLNTIKVKIEINKIVLPMWEGDKRALNSLCKVKITLLQSRDQREGEDQYKKGINKSPKIVEVQLTDRLKNLDEGSKIENKLAIIFSFFLVCVLMKKSDLFY